MSLFRILVTSVSGDPMAVVRWAVDVQDGYAGWFNADFTNVLVDTCPYIPSSSWCPPSASLPSD